MSFTKVAPAGIGTEPGDGITIGDSFLHTTGIDIGHNTGIGVTIRKHGDATFTGIITASSFDGSINASNLTGALPAISGANLTGIDATAIKFGSDVKVQANASGANVTGILTVTKNADSKTTITGSSVGVGTTTTAGRNAGVATATGTLIFNSTTSLMEYYSGNSWIPIDAPPTVTSVNNTNIKETEINAGFDIVVTGNSFKSGASVRFIGNDGSTFSSPTVAVNSSSQITARVPTTVTNAKEPFDVEVTNISGLSNRLEDAFNVNAKPIWSTNAGNLVTIADNATGTHATVGATDPESDTITYSGTVGGGMSVNSSTGAITGDPTDVSSNTTVTFTLNATSSGINTTPRTFNIIVTPHLGGQHNPAASAKAIYDTGNRTNGVYYLTSSSGTYQTYCWIDANSGGGYHLVAKIDRNNPSDWFWSGSRWTTSSEVNASNLQNINNSEGVNRGYYEYTLQTGFRMAGHYNPPSNITNYLSESKTGNTAKHFFTNSSGSQNSRADFISWFQGAGNDSGFITNFNTHQPNCNDRGFARTTNSSYVRWGITGNNENDCNTNDSTIGFGGQHYNNNGKNASGGQATHAGTWNRPFIGYIFVQ